MHTYIVQESKKITPSTLLLTLRRDESERPLAFQPGQYAAINYERDGSRSTTRCFSFVSSPTDQNTLQFSMRVRGYFTTALSRLEKGDIVNVGGPYGGFVFDTERDKKAVLMAGGIGITPFMSMMRYLSALDAKNEVVLFYSCQTQDDIPFGEELLAMGEEHPNLKTVFVVGKGPTDKLPKDNVASGFISPELVEKMTGKLGDKRFFICGPPGFMTAMLKGLTKRGVSKNVIMTEAFTQSSPKQTSILRSWPANAYALGVIGVVLGSLVVTVTDLLRWLPSDMSGPAPTASSPYLITNARQQQLDQLVNSIPPSPSVITAPDSTGQQTSPTVNPQTTTQAPIYQAPAPRTTASAIP